MCATECWRGVLTVVVHIMFLVRVVAVLGAVVLPCDVSRCGADNGIGEEGGKAVAEHLRDVPGLQELYLSGTLLLRLHAHHVAVVVLRVGGGV